MTDDERIDSETRVLGMPLISDSVVHRDLLEEKVVSESDWLNLGEKTVVIVAGEILNVREIKTKSGKPMAFIDIGFGSREWSLTLFQKQLEACRPMIAAGRAIMVQGKKERGGVLVDQMCQVSELAAKLNRAQSSGRDNAEEMIKLVP